MSTDTAPCTLQTFHCTNRFMTKSRTGPSACLQDVSQSYKSTLLLLQYSFLSSLKPSTPWYELLWGYKDHNKQPATRKMQGRGNKQKADHPIFWNWNLQGPKWQQDVNTLNPTVISFSQFFLWVSMSKDAKGFHNLRLGFSLKKTF